MKLLNVNIKRANATLFTFREAVTFFEFVVSDVSANTVQVDVPVVSASVSILTSAELGTYDDLVPGDIVEIYSDEQQDGAKNIVLYLQTATHYATEGKLELVCNRRELTSVIPFSGVVDVTPGLTAKMLEKVSVEGSDIVEVNTVLV